MIQPAATSVSAPDTAPGATAQRIVEAARRHLFSDGYAALTMDLLAQELGMSKRTLYLHFPSKEALIGGIIDTMGREVRARMEKVVENHDLSFLEKLCAVIEVAVSTLGRLSPSLLRQLQRSAPELYQKIEDLRARNIPYVFGRLFHEGIAVGIIRPDTDPEFLVEFWLHAIRGLAHPETLERTQLTLRQTLEKAMSIFFGGILTPSGRKEYSRHFPCSAKHATS